MSKQLTGTEAPAEPIPQRGRKPERVAAGAQATQQITPRHDASRRWPFVLVFTGNWDLGEYDGKPILLPVIDPRANMPGSQNIKQRKKGQPPDTRKRDGAASEKGHIVFRGDDVLDAIEVDEGGDRPVKYYYPPWDDVTEYPDGAVVVRYLPEVHDAWRVDLLKRQVIPRPHEGHLQTLERVRGSLLHRADNHPDGRGYWDRKADRLRKELKLLRPAFEATLELMGGAR